MSKIIFYIQVLFVSAYFIITLGVANAAGSKPFAAVMAPLYVNDEPKFINLLKEAKDTGVDVVSVDIWWGLVFRDRNNPDWRYYDNVFALIAQQNLKIAPILSIHKCGDGPGDNCLCATAPPLEAADKCTIPIPKWLYTEVAREAGYGSEDLKYQSETGKVLDDAIVPWITENGQGQPIMDAIKGFFSAFKEHYASYAKNGKFSELNISLGPTGELRYPAYNETDGWKFPDRGYFQSYSFPARKSFQSWVLNKYKTLDNVNREWGISLSENSQIRPPNGDKKPKHSGRASEFVARQDYSKTAYGRDFVDWYSKSLIAHGERILKAANDVFDQDYSAIPIGFKIPGVHWQIKCTGTPRIAEITAGLITPKYNLQPSIVARGDAYGYKDIFEMAKKLKSSMKRDIAMHFTALEMDNDVYCCNEKGEPSTSMAESLVFWISEAAEDSHITLKGENALACVGGPDDPLDDDRNWDRIESAFKYGIYSGFTLLRLEKPEKLENGECNPWGTDKDFLREFIQHKNTFRFMRSQAD